MVIGYYWGVIYCLGYWTNGRKCDCRARGFGYDSQLGQSFTELTEHFSDFWKFLSFPVCPLSAYTIKNKCLYKIKSLNHHECNISFISSMTT